MLYGKCMTGTKKNLKRILCLVLALCMVVPMSAFTTSATSDYTFAEETDNWNVWGANYYNDNSGYEWVNEAFEVSTDNGKLGIVSPGTKNGAVGFNEGAQIVAEAKNKITLDGFGIALDLRNARYPMDNGAFSVGVTSNANIGKVPGANATAIKGAANIATGANDVIVTLTQIVLNKSEMLNKITAYVGGEEVGNEIINWVATTYNSDMSLTFKETKGANGMSTYTCSVFAATLSGQTGKAQGATTQTLTFEAPSSIEGYPIVYSGAVGDNVYNMPDFTINNIRLNEVTNGTSRIAAADFAGCGTITYSYQNAPDKVVPEIATETKLVGLKPTLTTPNPSVYEIDGYKVSFYGWYDGSNQLTADSVVTGDMNITGKWINSARDFTISYKDMGDSAFSGSLENGAPVMYTFGEGATLKSASKLGYTFGGWYDNAQCEGEAVTEISAESKGEVTFYAKWIAHSYTIEFDAQQGTNAPAAITRTFGASAQNLPAETPKTPAGKLFAGWAKSATGSAKYAAGAVINDADLYPGADGATVTLYAVYANDPYYHVSFDLNCPASSTLRYIGASASSYFGTVYNVEQAQTFALKPINASSGAYYVYADRWGSVKGWASTKENADNGIADVYEYPDNNEHNITINYPAIDTDGDHNVTLYAVWQRVICVDAGTNGNGGKSYVGVYAGNDGYAILTGSGANGESNDIEGKEFNSQLSAKYSVSPANESAVFNGWNLSADGKGTRILKNTLTNAWFNANYPTGGNLNIYAKWQIKGYTIHYYNGSSLMSEQFIPVEAEGTPVTVTLWGKSEFAAKAPGWALVGWTTSYSNAWDSSGKSYGSKYFEPGQQIVITGDFTIYGYATKTDLQLRYNSNGGYWDHGCGSGVGNDLDSADRFNETMFGLNTPCTSTSASYYKFPSETPNVGRQGYRLHTSLNYPMIARFYTADGKGHGYATGLNNGYGYDCWPDGASGSFLASYLGLSAGDTLTLYVAWDPIITYNMNYAGGAVVQDYNYITSGVNYKVLGLGGATMYSSNCDFEERTPDGQDRLLQNREGYTGLPSIPYRSGYTLKSWNTEPDGSGTSYIAGREYNFAEPVTLYAQWSKAESGKISIKYRDQGNKAYSGGNLPSLVAVHTNGKTTNLVNGAKTGYTFAGWYTDANCTGIPVTSITASQNLTSTITLYAKWTQSRFTVTFKDGAGVETLATVAVNAGQKANYTGLTPTVAPSASSIYTFDYWTLNPGTNNVADISNVKSNMTVYAHFSSTPRTYTVLWKNGDTVIETDLNVPYGTTPTYNGATPVGDGTFLGWSPEVKPVSGSVIYKAVFGEKAKSYTVTWKNEDGTVLEIDAEVEEGTTPVYNSALPTKQETAAYRYTFAGWTPEVVPATEDAVYTAKYTAIAKKYTITWKNEDGTILETDKNVPGGTIPTYDGDTPTKASTAAATYEFAGWTPEVTEASANTTYTAKFTEIPKKYKIAWMNYNGTVLELDEDVTYGTIPEYNGATPVRPADDKYTYTFNGWAPVISPVTDSTFYTAQFTKTPVTPSEGPKYSVKNYTLTINTTEGLTLIRMCPCTYYTSAEIKAANGLITLDQKTVNAHITDGVFTYELPKEGKWSAYLRYSDGKEYIINFTLDNFNVEIDASDVFVTVKNLAGVKDFYIGKGELNTYRDVKNNLVFGATDAKIGTLHDYTYNAVLGTKGTYTLWVRYNDTAKEPTCIHFFYDVPTPEVTNNGKSVTVTELEGIKAIRVAKGSYETPGEVKRAESGCTTHSAALIEKKAVDGAYTFKLPSDVPAGTIYTVAVMYKNSYYQVFTIEA